MIRIHEIMLTHDSAAVLFSGQTRLAFVAEPGLDSIPGLRE
jgi:hypothetical protein